MKLMKRCLYEIEYDGKYKYSLEEAYNIKDKLHKLKIEFPFTPFFISNADFHSKKIKSVKSILNL
jgi:hypothetical protein